MDISMDISTFLAKLIGLYLLIVSLIWMFRPQQIEGTCKELVSSKGLLAVSAEISLIVGLVIAIDHSIWELSWRGLITVLGYLLILKGILRFESAAAKGRNAVFRGDPSAFEDLRFRLDLGTELERTDHSSTK